jgi:hypothetical protein
MANLIQIKRSNTTSIPTSLANGEMAYTSNGEILYIGSNGAVTAVTGKRFPGVLTANQALVANSTSGIDKVIVANLQPTGVYANGSLGSGGQVLTSNSTGVYWSSPTSGVAGSNTQVMYNGSGALSGSAGFTFDFAANNLNIANTTNSASHTVGSNFIANSTAIVGTGYANVTTSVNSALLTVGTSFIANSTGAYHTGTVNAASHTVGSSFIANATAIVGTGYANVTGSVNAASHTVGTTFTANATLVNAAALNIVNQVNTATLYVTTSANIGTAFTANSSLANVIALNIVNTTNTQYLNVSKDVSIAGNLSVTGTLVTINVSTLAVTDPLIRLASNNTSTSDNIDIGIYGNYTNSTSSYYTALYRDNTSKYWKLLDNITSEPTTTITGGSQAILQSYLNSGGLVSNSTAVTLTANSTVAVNMTANTLTLSTALAGTSGGTGLNTYTAEDILVANSTNGFRKLSVGSEGHILQVSSGVVAFGPLDGGSF